MSPRMKYQLFEMQQRRPVFGGSVTLPDMMGSAYDLEMGIRELGSSDKKHIPPSIFDPAGLSPKRKDSGQWHGPESRMNTQSEERPHHKEHFLQSMNSCECL
jgi:hypothetical protein